MSVIPQRLRSDGIREALVEIRFRSAEQPELTMAKLLSAAAAFGQGSTVERLPLADLPAPIRRSDRTLAHQPTMQVRLKNNRLIRLGEEMVSYHALQPYPGWEIFQPEIAQAVTLAADKTSGVVVTGLGFRYLNLLSPSQEVKGLGDLRIDLCVADVQVGAPLNLNYMVNADQMQAVVRIASPEFVQGPIVKDFSAMVDIEIRSASEKTPQKKNEILSWIEAAHTLLKQQFFGLLKQEVLEKLK